jgi:twitching motility protein PilT
MVEAINCQRDGIIVTVEDPIEYVLDSKRCFIKQREVGSDTHSFNAALRHVLRQDPDVILVGEIRDEETMSTALRAAETGHLVFATLHTGTCPMTIRRVVDFFAFQQQEPILGLLSTVLRAVVCQRLLPKREGGKVLASEVMICTPAVQTLVRENKIEQLDNAIRTGKKAGMHTFEESLASLARRGLIQRPEPTEDGMLRAG